MRYDHPADREIVALFAACLAYGRVDLFSPWIEWGPRAHGAIAGAVHPSASISERMVTSSTASCIASIKTTLRLPATLLRQTKHYAVDSEEDVQDIVAEALRAFLAKKSKRA